MKTPGIIRFASLPSTSTYAKENAANLARPSLIIADCQTGGRGRQGKSFYSPDGTGLYFTLLFDAEQKADMITVAAAVAVCEALEKLASEKPSIKWVNDVFIGGKKVCGILTECIPQNGKRTIALGIGINLTTEAFPPDIPQAGSIGCDCDKVALALEISNAMLSYASNPDNDEIRRKYEERLFLIGKEISYYKNNVEYTATVSGINDLCHLVVTDKNGVKDTLSSGEISIRI